MTYTGMLPSTSDKPPKPRHRASVACTTCRERRTRCVIFPNDSECTQCRATGGECVLNYDDERRKPNSRAYIKGLNARIAMLENALQEKEQGGTVVVEVDQQQSPQISSADLNDDTLQSDPKASEVISTNALNDAAITDSDVANGYSPPTSLSFPGNETMVNKLLSTTGHLSFDQLSGRLRYFGPTTNCHVHSDLRTQNTHSQRQALEQQRRTQKVINTIPVETHDYLMDSFWQHYNIVLHVVHRAAFEESREHGGQFYSGYLHVCILAMGFRKADKSRADIKRISMPIRESTLHQAAKFMLDYEIEQPAGIPLIQALLLLGDLECGVGRDNLGWLYAGMANRLCFDIGLHLDRSNSGLLQQEIEIGKMTLLACVIYDRYWALFLGRPTSLKSSDLETYSLTEKFVRLGTCLPAGAEKSLETQVYESLLDLMEIAGKITEIMDQASRLGYNVNSNHHVFIRMANLNRELEMWYTHLPKPLQWTSDNVQSGPISFFLLHQQYHATVILLNRPFAMYGGAQSPNPDNTKVYLPQPETHLSTISRTICTQHAVQIARIFWQHRQRFNTKQIFVTGLQHAGTAAIALVAALASLKDSSSRDANMHYLETLAAALEDMSETYQPAERMSAVLQAVIVELRATLPQPLQKKVVPTRRESAVEDEMPRPGPGKRHQSFRVSPPQRTSAMFVLQSQQNPIPSIRSNHASLQCTSDNNVHSQTELESPVVMDSQGDAVNLEGAWPSLANTNAPAMNYPMFTSGRLLNMGMNTSISKPQDSAWMGAETPAVSPPPPASTFTNPLLNYQTDRIPDDSSGAHGHHLDFLSLLSGNRSDSSGLEGKDGDFTQLPTPLTTPAIASRAERNTAATKSPSLREESVASKTPDSAARTMADLDDLLNQMRGSSKVRHC